jgi:FixJ family two-component response regulator
VTIPFVGVVDDDEALCSSLVDLMRSTGYCAESFASAEALLTFDRLSSLDCIVADVHMPGKSGFELIEALNDDGVTIPVILITALSDKKLDEDAVSRGALCLLRKPFETTSLIDWIERSLLQ